MAHGCWQSVSRSLYITTSVLSPFPSLFLFFFFFLFFFCFDISIALRATSISSHALDWSWLDDSLPQPERAVSPMQKKKKKKKDLPQVAIFHGEMKPDHTLHCSILVVLWLIALLTMLCTGSFFFFVIVARQKIILIHGHINYFWFCLYQLWPGLPDG